MGAHSMGHFQTSSCQISENSAWFWQVESHSYNDVALHTNVFVYKDVHIIDGNVLNYKVIPGPTIIL